ncbi:MAG: UDP-N-acetylmuramoyl-L-alanine--D-glutamate ligase [Chitinophagaceae bacterium]
MNKRMVILGAGESGVGAAILCRKEGFSVFVSDAGSIQDKYKQELAANEIEFEEGGHSEERILGADEVMKSPGIPHKTEMVQKLLAAGIIITSEIELAYRFKGKSKIIGITGSNGKTTTTALTYHICKEAGLDCALVGNIGISIARQVALDPKSLYVAEISSFQLDDIQTFRPDVAILTNITEDHLDRYEYNFENYIRAKFNIIKNQNASDHFIYCEDDPVTMNYLTHFSFISNPLPITMNREIPRGAFIANNRMTVTGNEPLSMSIYDFALKGKHNQYNTMAACLAATIIGIRKEKIRDAVKTFESLEHRMETVMTIRGVQFINDSKATNVNSTWFALENMSRPVILILGGVDKGNDYSLIMDMVKEKVKAIVCLGKDNIKIHKAFGNEVEVIVNTDNAIDAVKASFHLASKGDVVLLSPACASFDLFSNYEDRGRQFKEAVKEL